MFYMSFDIKTDLVRKNPAAAIEAFRAAFERRDDIHLAIKLNNSDAFERPGSEVQRLRNMIADHPNIIVIDQTMDYREILSLSASCDIYVSLHRSEGLGLNLLEAMSLGKPAIATAGPATWTS